MKLDQIMEIGQQVQLHHRKGAYTCFLLDVTGELIYISVPQLRGRWVSLPAGEEVTLSFGVKDRGIVRGTTQVQAQLSRPAPALVLRAPAKLERDQQRHFYRLPVHLPVNYRIVTSLSAHRALHTYTAQAHDISAGGMYLIAQYPLQDGDLLELDFYLADVLFSSLLATVVRTIWQESSSNHGYGLQFRTMPARIEESIVRWVFQEQSRRRRLGLQ